MRLNHGAQVYAPARAESRRYSLEAVAKSRIAFVHKGLAEGANAPVVSRKRRVFQAAMAESQGESPRLLRRRDGPRLGQVALDGARVAQERVDVGLHGFRARPSRALTIRPEVGNARVAQV